MSFNELISFLLPLLCVALIVALLSVHGTRKTLIAAKVLLVLWSVIFLSYTALIAWSIYAWDIFGGNSGDRMAQVWGLAHLVFGSVQLGLIILLVKHETKARLYIPLALSLTLFAIYARMTISVSAIIATVSPASMNFYIIAAFAIPRLLALAKTKQQTQVQA